MNVLHLVVSVLLCTISAVSSFDLVSTLLSQGSAGLKSIMSPEMLNKMRDIIPPSGSSNPADIHEIEKLLSKLRPAQGRFDPALLELLASMDASRRTPGLSTPRSRHSKTTTDSTVPRLEILNFPDESSHSVSSTTLHSYTTEGRPKFSSKFRIQNQKEPSADSTSPMVIDHVSDPNLRNHRLYDVNEDQRERYENYENFTQIDQLEDLMADETLPQVVVSIPKSPKHKSSPGKGKGPVRNSIPKRKPVQQSTEVMPPTTSDEELMSMETTEENTSRTHEREALRRASTEKTIVYSHSLTGPSSERPYPDHGTTMAFKPSPVDLSAPMYAYAQENDRDDYFVQKIKPKLRLKRPRRPIRRMSSSSPRPGHNPKFDDSFHYDEDYEKEQPDYQHIVNYLKLQGQPVTQLHSTTPHSSSSHRGTPGHHGYTQQQITPQPIPAPPMPRQPYGNILNPGLKQDRILTPADMPHTQQQHHHQQIHSQITSPSMIQPHSVLYPDQYHRYVPAASENVYNDVHTANAYNYYPHAGGSSSSSTDLAYSAGQNYYHSNHDQGHGYQQQASHGQHQGYNHHYPHHVEESSSWSSTLLILGGLIALSAAIAFLLPSFVTGGVVPSGGKDTGDKNVSSDNNDLWKEIKGLYNDIVSLARGDYTTFHKYNEQNLPKINIVDDEEEEEYMEDHDGGKKKGQISRLALNKRHGVPVESSEEEQHQHKNLEHVHDNSSASPLEEHGEEEDEEADNSDANYKTSERPSKTAERPKRKRVVDKDSLAFAIYGKDGLVGKSKQNYNFANAFNQTLNAWEQVPLITN